MKSISLFVVIAIMSYSGNTNAQLLRNAKNMVETKVKANGLSENDAADGIKEALSKGTGEGVKIVSQSDGYFGNAEIKIPFPESAKDIESKLRSVGLGKKVDEVVLAMNRGAEDAAKEAEELFLTAIKNMSIKDAINIVKGENDAATQYLKRTTSPGLKMKFKPIIKTSLDKVNATALWKDLITSYNQIPLVKKQNPDLPDYVTKKAIDGLFIMIAKKELDIRNNPMGQSSELLKKVFSK